MLMASGRCTDGKAQSCFFCMQCVHFGNTATMAVNESTSREEKMMDNACNILDTEKQSHWSVDHENN